MTMIYPAQPHNTTRQRAAAPNQSSASDGLSINMLLAAALAFAIIAALVGFGGDAAANGPLQPASEDSALIDDTIEVYVVQPGDTLWAVATEVARPGEDVRPIVDALKEITGGAQLDIGQQIVIDHATIGG